MHEVERDLEPEVAADRAGRGLQRVGGPDHVARRNDRLMSLEDRGDKRATRDEADDRVWLTEFILSEMRTLNDKLPVQTFVESESQPGAWSELEVLREEIEKVSMFEEIVGISPALQAVISRVTRVAPTESTVLITGETEPAKS